MFSVIISTTRHSNELWGGEKALSEHTQNIIIKFTLATTSPLLHFHRAVLLSLINFALTPYSLLLHTIALLLISNLFFLLSSSCHTRVPTQRVVLLDDNGSSPSSPICNWKSTRTHFLEFANIWLLSCCWTLSNVGSLNFKQHWSTQGK